MADQDCHLCHRGPRCPVCESYSREFWIWAKEEEVFPFRILEFWWRRFSVRVVSEVLPCEDLLSDQPPCFRLRLILWAWGFLRQGPKSPSCRQGRHLPRPSDCLEIECMQRRR